MPGENKKNLEICPAELNRTLFDTFFRPIVVRYYWCNDRLRFCAKTVSHKNGTEPDRTKRKNILKQRV